MLPIYIHWKCQKTKMPFVSFLQIKIVILGTYLDYLYWKKKLLEAIHMRSVGTAR